MHTKIFEIFANKPKLFSQIIKRDINLSDWVKENSLVVSDNFSEMIYSAIYQENNICHNGNQKKFSGFNTGYTGCGRAKTCECVRHSTSVSVTEAKKLITKEEQEEINKKRSNTNLEKYGVTCVAQTEENKQKLQDFYADPVKVAATFEKIKNTYLTKYGVENCRHLPESEEKRLSTILTKYNVTNVSQIPSTKAKLQARIAQWVISGHLIEKGYERFTKYLDKKYNFALLTSCEEYKESRHNGTNVFSFRCNACQTEVTKKFNYGRILNCEHCNPSPKHYVSNEEQEVFDYIQNELGILGGIQSDRKLINPFEIDMLFEDQKIAIEYCGLYWHSEISVGKDQKYHARKMQLVNEHGYQLITIFSDEWNLKKDLVKSKLQNIFKVNSTKYQARKLTIAEISQGQSKQFLNEYHLQGYGIANVNVGLVDPKTNELIALMTFSKGRKALNTKILPGEYELVRFVTKAGASVAGGASRLLSYFIKTYNPVKIISYADLRWSVGNVYEKLGFTKTTAPTIGYWYVDEYKKRIHRFNFTKSVLIKEGADPKKTEWQIMQELGYDRIWDCGHQKYVLGI